MKIISFPALKGGVGKTSLCFNVAGFLSEQYNVLLIDLDAQANLTANCGLDASKYLCNTSADLFNKFTNEPNNLIIKVQKNISIIPSNIFLYETENEIFLRANRENILKNYFKKHNTFFNNFDFILIDVNPSFSIINKNVFMLANSLFAVSDLSFNGLQGLELFRALWGDLRSEFNKADNLKGIIINNADKRLKIYREMLEFIETTSLKNLVLETKIFSSVQYKIGELENKPINQLSKQNSNTYKNYATLLDEILRKI